MTKSTGQERLAEINRLFRERQRDAPHRLLHLFNDLLIQPELSSSPKHREALQVLMCDYAAMQNGGVTLRDSRDSHKPTEHRYAGDLSHVLARVGQMCDSLPKGEPEPDSVKTLNVPALNLAAYASRR